MKILIVDDDKNMLLMLKLHLSGKDRQVATASDSFQALGELKGSGFDWLVVDGQMDEVDGLQLAKEAKALQPDLGIVMVSGVYTSDDIKGSPISKLFPKPVDTDALLSYLQSGRPDRRA